MPASRQLVDRKQFIYPGFPAIRFDEGLQAGELFVQHLSTCGATLSSPSGI